MVASDVNRKSRRILENPWLAVALIALTAVIIYSNIYQGEFVFDDVRAIEKNQTIRGLSKFLSLNQLVKPRSIVDLTFALNYSFGGLNVVGYHIVNLIIHIVNGVIVYFLALTIFRQIREDRGQSPKPKGDVPPQSSIINHQSSIPTVALFAALIFIAHPIQTQAVTYTAQRYASLAALFFMASVLFYLKGRIIAQNSKLPSFCLQSSAFYVLCIISGILAFMSKQNTASLPAVILLVEYLCIDNTWKGWKKKLPWIGLAFVLCLTAVLYVSGGFGVIGRGGSLLEDVSDFTRDSRVVSRWSYLCTQFNVVVVYIRLLFFPVGQNADDMYPFRTGFFDGVTPLAFLFLTGLVLLAVWRRKKTPVITLAVFWFFITLSVESSIIPIRDALFEHRLYLPMFGFALAVSYALFYLFSRRELWGLITSLGIIIVLGTATYQRNRVWQDYVSLWTDVVEKSPHNFRAHTNLGIGLYNEHKTKKAISHFLQAIKLRPNYDLAHYNLGLAFEEQGALKPAVAHYREALRIKPGYVKAHVNLGIALAREGNLEEAVSHFLAAIRFKPNSAEAHLNLGITMERQGNLDGAVKHYSKALKLNPGSPDVHYHLGVILARTGKSERAMGHFSEVLERRPDSARAHHYMGVLLARQGNIDGAAHHFAEVARIKPGSADARINLGLLLARKGDLRGAVRQLSEALRIDPGSEKARRYLQGLYGRLGNRTGPRVRP